MNTLTCNTLAPPVDIGGMISRSPELRGGRPCITGTGVTVARIAGWHRMGMEPEQIAAEYGHLTLAQVHAALAYYHTNRDEIDADLADEAAQYDLLARQSQIGRQP